MIRRRLVPALVSAGLLAAILGQPSGLAQTASVSIHLRSQTPSTSVADPRLQIRFAVQNAGAEELADLEIEVQIRTAVTSRTAYETSLRADVGGVLHEETSARPGTIPAAGNRVFDLNLDMSPYADPDDSRIYPLRIALLSGGSEVAVLRTPVVHLVRPPLVPLGLTWTFVVSAPLRFLPRGAFMGDDMATDLAPNGRIGAQIAALSAFASQPGQGVVDVILSPVLLDQLDRMRRGYAVQLSNDPYDVKAVPVGEGGALLADRALETLALIASSPRVRLGLMPYSEPSLPSLVASGFAGDVEGQLKAGSEEVAELLGVRPDPTVVRPPRSALDQVTLETLAGRGVQILVLDAGAVETPEQRLGFAAPAEAPLAVSEDETIAALAPNDAFWTLLNDPVLSEDPVLLAQVAIGELAAVWQEAPGTDRTLAFASTELAALPAAFYRPFITGVGSAPWLDTRAAAVVATALESDAEPVTLAPQIAGAFPADYVQAIRDARLRVRIYGSMLEEESTDPQRLQRMLLLAQSATFLDDLERGRGFIAQVDGDASAMLQSVHPLPDQQVTLTSTTGSVIPLRVANDATVPLNASIRLVSQHLAAPVDIERTFLPGDTQTLTFDVDLKTSGRFPLQIQVVAPGGEVVSTTVLFVRSTELNRQALAIVIGAGILLVLLWARRFLPRRGQ